MSSAIFEPYQLGSITLKNRIVLAPLTRGRAGPTRTAGKLQAEYYKQRAGAGLLITEGTFVSEQAVGWNGAPGLYTEQHAEGWREVTEAVKGTGAHIFAQLWHTGRSSHSSFHSDGSLPVAPSPIAISGEVHTPTGKVPYEIPHALTVPEIAQIVRDYKRAAQLAQSAGFDGVEIHSANGYLLDEFLQSKTNKREDEYGGSLPNRFRLLREVVEAVTSVFPSSRVGVRLAPNGVYNDMGSEDYLESFTYYIEQLAHFNLAYLHVLDGLAFGFHKHGEPFTLKKIREHYKGTVIGNCGYELDTARQAIDSHEADLIAFGRAFISNPDLVERFQNNWPLNPPADYSTWYSETGPVGYTDFPAYSPPAV